MTYVLFGLACFGVVTSSVFAGMVLWAVPRFLRERRAALAALAARPGFTPPLTLLKPVHGAEPGLEAHLATFFEQDYPEYEILFCARSADDARLETARRVAARYPNTPARVRPTRIFRRSPSLQAANPTILTQKWPRWNGWKPRPRTKFWSSATAMCA